MNKILSVFLILILQVPVLKAQSVNDYILLDQSFDNSNYPNWSNINVVGNISWYQSGNQAAIAAKANTSSETWLISDAINLSGTINPILSFDYKWQFGGNTVNAADVLISGDYTSTGDPNLATWTSLGAKVKWATGYTFTNSGQISLSSFAGKSKCFIAFKITAIANAYSTRQHYLDNVLITSSSTIFNKDIDRMQSWLCKQAISPLSANSVNNFCRLLQSNGAFSDINYSSGKNLVQNCQRLNYIASAYIDKNSTLYLVDSLKQNYLAGLSYWVRTNQQTSNWWDRHINYTMNLWQGLVLMTDILKKERPALLDSAIQYQYWGYQLDNYMESANGMNKIHGAFAAAVIERNVSYILRMKKQVIDHINFQNQGEGLEVDFMFGAHSGTGRQAYLLNYGEQYILSAVYYLGATDSTFAKVGATEINQIENLFIQAVQWPIYQNANDPSQSGRFNQVTRGLGGIRAHLDDLLLLNTPQKSELNLVRMRINYLASKALRLNGNKMFWRFDYMIHRRSNFFSAHRLSSTRCVAGESGNGSGNFNYYNGSGVNYIYRTGKEFTDSLFAYGFNFRQYPGTTVEQDTATLPIITWGAGALNGNSFAGGASDGNNGAMGFKYSKRNIFAYKSTFYFDDKMVALGAGISQKLNTANSDIYTTINQCKQKGEVAFNDGLTQGAFNVGSKTTSNLKWIWHDSLLYIPLVSGSYMVQTENRIQNQKVFSLIINHGKQPNLAKYGYVIHSNVSKINANTLATDTSIQILQNDTLIQAVRNTNTGEIQAVFYSSNILKLKNGLQIGSNQPSVVLYKIIGSKIQLTVANPNCESNNPKNIVIEVNRQLNGLRSVWNGKSTLVTIDLPQGDYAGQSVTTTLEDISCTLNGALKPNINFTSPVNNSTTSNSQVKLDATVTGASVSSVAFYSGSKLLAIDATSPYSAIANNLTNGSYTFSAIGSNSYGCADTATVFVKISLITELILDNISEVIHVFPNPFDAFINVQSKIELTYKIYDIHGILIEKGQAGNNTQLGSHIPHGVYILQLIDNKGKINQYKINKH